MAVYNRNFLVPYLQDVCSLEMLISNLSSELIRCKEGIEYYSNQLNRPPLQIDSPKKSYHITMVVLIMTVVILFICMLLYCYKMSLGDALERLLSWGILIIGTAILSLAFFALLDNVTRSKEEYDYVVNVAAYRDEVNKQMLRDRPQNELALKQWNEYQVVVQNRLNDAKSLLKEVYNVNIIPSRYRNIYAAYYLYDYFSSCRETDLDKIIQTMLLDEIKQQLSTIIEQNEQIIVNQRMQIALQEESNQMQAKHHKELMQQLIRMESNQNLQLDYQKMFNRNQDVTNFFLAADYLRKS